MKSSWALNNSFARDDKRYYNYILFSKVNDVEFMDKGESIIHISCCKVLDLKRLIPSYTTFEYIKSSSLLPAMLSLLLGFKTI